MEGLVVHLLKLLLQVVIFLITGRWFKLGGGDPSQDAPRKGKARLPRSLSEELEARARALRRAMLGPDAKSARQSTRQGTRPGSPQTPWPFDLDGEALEAEPYAGEREDDDLELGGEELTEEARGGELARAPTFRRKVAPRRGPVLLAMPAVRPRRSIAQAMRDPTTVREAIVLGAALGPRAPRR